MSDSVPATLPPRKNYDEDSNQSGALRQAVYLLMQTVPLYRVELYRVTHQVEY